MISVYMRQFADNAEKLTAAGIIMLGVTALMLMSTVERTFNAIWRVRRGRPLLQQSMVYWTVLTLGPVVLAYSLMSWRWLFKLTHFERNLPMLAHALETGGSIVLTALVLSLIFRIVPNRFVPFRHAAGGALLTSILLELTKVGFGFYIGKVASYQLVYGAFASVPIFLLWVYCLWLVVLAGAVFTASLSHWDGQAGSVIWRRVGVFWMRWSCCCCWMKRNSRGGRWHRWNYASGYRWAMTSWGWCWTGWRAMVTCKRGSAMPGC
ncbi:YihY family inner membrane protein [Paludibacterium denitrificans]|uniref:YihY family inner membrane protein n=1 Tax=Paludibacterium denitrificans TaxID=2675226 RepID=UPI001E406109|nr:YihY family inner membrane protein [Paludibacterium denitrificans]